MSIWLNVTPDLIENCGEIDPKLSADGLITFTKQPFIGFQTYYCITASSDSKSEASSPSLLDCNKHGDVF